MERTIWTIESNEGYLYDIEQYTQDVSKAVDFPDLDTALRRLTLVRKKLTKACWITAQTLPFPRKDPVTNG